MILIEYENKDLILDNICDFEISTNLSQIKLVLIYYISP
jgi:hypothetical protein